MMEMIPDQHAFDARYQQLEHQGYTLVPDAIPAEMLRAMRQRFEELVANVANVPTAERRADIGSINFNRFLELDPVFEPLIDMPSVMPYVEKAHGGDVRLLGSPIGSYIAPRSIAHCGWHNDSAVYTRLTFLLSDLAENGGPTAVVPGTHRCPDNPPAWVNDEKGQPRQIPGMVRGAARAGDCLINNTMIWHTATPNESDQARRLVWVVYKREAQPLVPPSQYNLLFSRGYFEKQADPRRRRLMELGVEPAAGSGDQNRG